MRNEMKLNARSERMAEPSERQGREEGNFNTVRRVSEAKLEENTNS